ncbi:hypothetical protein [Auritidibacter ignavus]|uniref:hypothetical protein n=1 Tax=Auritidibacter ignavus TaxID=678932 RepID=UPI001699D99C|nr:hypothetical protein [Auritidibacter ignavus]NIH72740.1 hypothetical protein [Auritidibacter ignavus]
MALSRALDLGLYRRINPLTGTEITAWDHYVGATEYSAELSASVEPDQVVRATAGLLINRDRPVSVHGFAIVPRLTWELSNLQTKNADGSPSGTQRYPNLGLGAGISSFLGLNTAKGDTVSERPEATTDTGVRGILGDFTNGIRWGVQREFPVEKIMYGDPDGQGALSRHNQIALRLEIVYGWYVFADRFALVKTVETAGSEG